MTVADWEEYVRTIAEFLDETTKLFEQIVGWREVLFDEDIRDDIEAAWNEIKSRDVIAKVLQGFDQLDQWKRAEAGLAGRNLDLKLNAFGRALRRFRKQGTVRWLRPVLKWLNTILGTLASLIPGGEVLKEYKESIEHGLDAAEAQ